MADSAGTARRREGYSADETCGADSGNANAFYSACEKRSVQGQNGAKLFRKNRMKQGFSF